MPRPHYARYFLPQRSPDGGDGSGAALTREQVEEMLKGRFGADINPDMLRRLADLTQGQAKAEGERDAAKAALTAAEARTPEGAVVLTGDEATAYTALKARDGYDAAPLARATADLDAGKDALGKLTGIEATAAEDAAIRAAGYDPARFRKYLSGVKPRMEGEGDAARAVVTVTAADGTESTKPLADVLASDYAEALPILSGDAGTQARRGGETLGQRTAAATSGGTSLLDDAKRRQRETARPDLHRATPGAKPATA